MDETGKQDVVMECALPGCTDIVAKTRAMLHVRRRHPELAELRKTVTCPKCNKTLLGNSYPKHYVSHFPSYECPYGCGAPLARITVSERKRHYLSCGMSRQTGLTWEQADAIALRNGELPIPMKGTDAEGRRKKREPKAKPVVEQPEELDYESEEECLPPMRLASSILARAPPGDRAESEPHSDDSESDSSVEMGDAEIWNLDGKYGSKNNSTV